MTEKEDAAGAAGAAVGSEHESVPVPDTLVGIHFPSTASTIAAVTDGYNFISLPLTTPALQKALLLEGPKTKAQIDQALQEHTTMRKGTSGIMAFASQWLELDAKDPTMAQVSAQVLEHELAYASFVGIANVVIPSPQSRTRVAQYAAVVHALLQSLSPFMHISIHMPMKEDSATASSASSLSLDTTEGTFDEFSLWEVWQTIQRLCNYHPRLSLALQITPTLPSALLIDRFFAEPVRIVVLAADIFLANAKGWPVLSRSHQALVHKYMALKPVTLLKNTELAATKGGHTAFLVYMRHLHASRPAVSVTEQFAAGYQDFLQVPLQPLTDNLESMTYEVFEKDPVKYEQYEKAITAALRARKEKPVRIAVVGAGRGPIIERVLRAAKNVGRAVELWAVEKNPSAFITLVQRNTNEWNKVVHLVKIDMRRWSPPKPMHIVVSELLGSFGDNEASPECVDGIMHRNGVLDSSGVCIPQKYSAHIQPIMCSKMHAAIQAQKTESAFETPYVVLLQAYSALPTASTDAIQQLWEFDHTARTPMLDTENNKHNRRYASAKFQVDRGICHGVAGYFESVLYKDIEISTRPDRMHQVSPDMFSWFPIYFPLQVSLSLL